MVRQDGLAAVAGKAFPVERMRRFADVIDDDQSITPQVLADIEGDRLKARHILHVPIEMSPEVTGYDHTLIFHIGEGSAHRFSDSSHIGTSGRLRTATLIPAMVPAQLRLHAGSRSCTSISITPGCAIWPPPRGMTPPGLR